MSLLELVPEYIREFEPYIPSVPDDVLKRRYRVPSLHRLNNNENPLGPAPAAVEAIRHYPPEQASVYPSGDCYHLRHELATMHNLSPEQFLVGNGANEVITFVIKAFCEAGDNIVTSDRTFAVYEWVAKFSGFEAKLIPLKDYRFDAQGMIDAIDRRTKILFICNPNNPTGTYWTKDEFHNFMKAVGPDRVVVLDEAYVEYVDSDDFPDGMEMIRQYPNVVVFRTFSKMYGLAALRVGYLAASEELVDLMRRTCIVYSVNSLAQIAAQAALTDTAHIESTRSLMRESRALFCAEMERLGLYYRSGVANYVMVRLPVSDTLVYKRLMKKGFMIRAMTGFRYPNHIRVSLSHPEIMTGLGQALGEVLAG